MFRLLRQYSTEVQAISAELKKNLVGLNSDQIHAEIITVIPTIKKFTAQQIFQWIYQKGADSFDQMTNLPLQTRTALENSYIITYGNTKTQQNSKDGTKKLLLEYADALKSTHIPTSVSNYISNTSADSAKKTLIEKPYLPQDYIIQELLSEKMKAIAGINKDSSGGIEEQKKQLSDGGGKNSNLQLKDFISPSLPPSQINKSPKGKSQLVETVFIPEDDRGTLCVSSQVGCALNCKFCHTGTQQFMRNLTPAEIVGQYLKVAYYLADFDHKSSDKRKISNIVFMGQGEPLLNYRSLKKSIDLLTEPKGIAFPHSKITVSTSGIAPLIEKVATELGVQLAVSLHATNDPLRSKIMPINKTYPIKTLMESVKKFSKHSSTRNKRVTFEYVLLNKVNDSHGDAVSLAKLIKGIFSHVNLIPFNPWPGSAFKPSPEKSITDFYGILLNLGVSASIRKPRGLDILAACGQLKSNNMSKKSAPAS